MSVVDFLLMYASEGGGITGGGEDVPDMNEYVMIDGEVIQMSGENVTIQGGEE